MRSRRLLWSIPILLAAAGCDSQLSVRTITRSGGATEPDALLVVEVSPSPSAAGVEPDTDIVITFSRAVDPATLGARPVIVETVGCSSPVGGTVTLEDEGTTIVFHPDSPLETPLVSFRVDLSDSLRALDSGPVDLSGSPFPLEFLTTPLNLSPLSFGGVGAAEAVSAISVRARWDPASDSASSPGEITYRVYAGRSAGQQDFSAPAAASGPGATEVLVSGLSPNTQYFLVVRAVDKACREDPNTAEIAVTTSKELDLVPPVSTGAESASAVSPSSILVAWQAATDNQDVASDIRYEVYRSTTSKVFDFGSPAENVVGLTSVEMKGLAPETTYFFVVRAFDTSDNFEPNTKEVSATTPPVPVSFAAEILPTWRSQCATSGCHTGARPAVGLNLSTWEGAVNDPFPRAAPVIDEFNSTGSLILWRTDDRNPHFRSDISGWRMPDGKPALSRAYLDKLARWIDQGALNN